MADAGCGCSKPPPAPAAVRPNVTYAGAPVTIFDPAFVAGQEYTLTFASGTTAAVATVPGQVVERRDLADGLLKPHLIAIAPPLPLGPTSITVSRPASSTAVPQTKCTSAPRYPSLGSEGG